MKSLSEQVRNDFIRSPEEKLEARLAKEATEKAEQEATKKAANEAAEKAVAKEKVEKEAKDVRVTEAAEKVESEKAIEVSLTQGESPTADLAPLVIRTLEELQKE